MCSSNLESVTTIGGQQATRAVKVYAGIMRHVGNLRALCAKATTGFRSFRKRGLLAHSFTQTKHSAEGFEKHNKKKPWPPLLCFLSFFLPPYTQLCQVQAQTRYLHPVNYFSKHTFRLQDNKLKPSLWVCALSDQLSHQSRAVC